MSLHTYLGIFLKSNETEKDCLVLFLLYVESKLPIFYGDNIYKIVINRNVAMCSPYSDLPKNYGISSHPNLNGAKTTFFRINWKIAWLLLPTTTTPKIKTSVYFEKETLVNSIDAFLFNQVMTVKSANVFVVQ
jgi:hypothetical protein